MTMTTTTTNGKNKLRILDDIYDKIRATILRLQECDCSAESSSQSSSQSESD